MRVDNTTFHFAGPEKVALENKSIKSAIPKLAEQPIKVSISKEGYESGTRQINVIDENSELGYRMLTMEEELSALDAAYEKNVKGFEEHAAQQNKAQAIIGEWKEQVAQIKSGVTTAQSVENMAGQDGGQDKLPENLAEKLLSVRDCWKAAYAVSGKDNAGYSGTEATYILPDLNTVHFCI